VEARADEVSTVSDMVEASAGSGHMTLDEAISLARDAHAGVTDKGGQPYIEHPLRVMEYIRADGERLGALLGNSSGRAAPEEERAACMAAVLHDVIEDTTVTAGDLIAAGCPPDVVAAVVALTRCAGESYEEFLRRLSANPLALRVKRADIDDNAAEARLAVLSAAEAGRLRNKYSAARRLLDDLSAYSRVLDTIAGHPDGHYRYFLNARAWVGLMRQWRWDEDGRQQGNWSWPEHLHPETTSGRWKVGNSYMLDAITGMGEDPYSCGEWCDDLTAKEAAKLARKMGVELDVPRLAP
jgi:hypothetical protein